MTCIPSCVDLESEHDLISQPAQHEEYIRDLPQFPSHGTASVVATGAARVEWLPAAFRNWKNFQQRYGESYGRVIVCAPAQSNQPDRTCERPSFEIWRVQTEWITRKPFHTVFVCGIYSYIYMDNTTLPSDHRFAGMAAHKSSRKCNHIYLGLCLISCHA